MIKTMGSHVAEVSNTTAPNALFIGFGVEKEKDTARAKPNQLCADAIYGVTAGAALGAKSGERVSSGTEVEVDATPIAHVLVCDDETRLGDLTAGLLEECGFAAGFVPSATDAMAYLDAHQETRVLLLDVNLSGGKSAHDLLTFLVTRRHKLRVVLTSGSAKQEVGTELTQHPLVVGYLEKPYAEEELTTAITSALAG
jgi:CheY-like chemotaxis protein